MVEKRVVMQAGRQSQTSTSRTDQVGGTRRRSPSLARSLPHSASRAQTMDQVRRQSTCADMRRAWRKRHDTTRHYTTLHPLTAPPPKSTFPPTA